MDNSSHPEQKNRKGEQTREKILEHAVELFYEHGFVKASTRQLVARAGMTSSAIYNHFTNKDEILFTIIHRAGDKVLLTLKEVTEKYDDPDECLRQMVSSMLYLFKADMMRKEIAIFIDELYQLHGDFRKQCDEQHRKIFELFREKIGELEKRNLINPINQTVGAFSIIGAMLWVYHWFRDNGTLSIEEIADEIIKLLFSGLMRKDTFNLR